MLKAKRVGAVGPCWIWLAVMCLESSLDDIVSRHMITPSLGLCLKQYLTGQERCCFAGVADGCGAALVTAPLWSRMKAIWIAKR
jgi:hypothetical protein